MRTAGAGVVAGGLASRSDEAVRQPAAKGHQEMEERREDTWKVERSTAARSLDGRRRSVGEGGVVCWREGSWRSFEREARRVDSKEIVNKAHLHAKKNHSNRAANPSNGDKGTIESHAGKTLGRRDRNDSSRHRTPVNPPNGRSSFYHRHTDHTS
ncbi:hypothetical protein CC80DRAFT_152113 [Byssothecium circinans]|uniref:Uncharacterized protein n=1 Tax=Byssothecium circinans TaxID=147558 RepID=A0A6A5TKJ4_9PLEO|nr:hypothetical protein CC80DRAFT_152113 [Byssothecium circinans]